MSAYSDDIFIVRIGVTSGEAEQYGTANQRQDAAASAILPVGFSAKAHFLH